MALSHLHEITMTSNTESRVWRGQIRMPAPLADWLKTRANGNYRSMNAEIVDLVLRAKERTEQPSKKLGDL